MGTNYYLKRKIKFKDSNTVTSYGCTGDLVHGVQVLNNGFVYESVYYPTVKELNENLYQTIHIGKSSYGWYFSLCIYPEIGINNIEDWKKLFSENTIENEYGDIIPPEEMLRVITERKHNSGRDFYTMDEKDKQLFVEDINDLYTHIVCNFAPYRDFEDYFKRSGAEPGKNGLLKHAIDKYTSHSENDETFDYIISGNDPETGCLFC